MLNQSIQNKSIINSRGVISTDYKIVHADEAFYKFVGPTIQFFTDSVHQVDMDDFVYVVESLNAFEEKSIVLRMRRYDNTFRWCLVTLNKLEITLDGVEHISFEVSDIINLNNHYLALTRNVKTNTLEYKYDELISENELFEQAKADIELQSDQVNMIILEIFKAKDIIAEYGKDYFNKMLDEITTELYEIIGQRGKVSKYNENAFLLVLKNIGNESNIRSFLEALRSRLRWKYISQNASMNLSFDMATAEYPRNGKDFDAIQKKLFKAIDIAHNKGSACYIIYKEELHGEL